VDLVRFGAVVDELLDRLGGRLFDDTRESVRSSVWTGEEGLAADELAGVLSTHRIPVSRTERDLLRELLYAFDVDGHEEEFRHLPSLHDRERVLAALNVVSDPPAPSPSPPPRSPDP